MANLTSLEDLKFEALDAAGELTDGTSDYDTRSVEFMNRLNRSIYAGSSEVEVNLGELWEWAKATDFGILEVLPVYETGTVSLTKGSASGTFSSAPGAGLGSFKKRTLKIDGRDTVYRIATHTAGSASFTLDQNYLEDTGATLDFLSAKIEYELNADLMRLSEPMRVNNRQDNEDPFGEVTSMETASFNKMWPLVHFQTGTPTRFAKIREENGLITIQFNRVPKENSVRAEYEYIPVPADLKIKEFLDADVNTGTDRITEADHGFELDELVQLKTSGTLPAGLATNVFYYILSPTQNDFQLSLTKGGSAVDITAAAGGGTHKVLSVPRIPVQYRQALSFYASWQILLDKSDSRADVFRRDAQGVLQAMLVANRRTKRHTSKDRGKLITRQDTDADFPRRFRPRVEGF